MKNNLRKIKMLFVLLFAIFFSCEKDLYENGLQNNANNITQKHIKLKDLDIKTISKINQKITEAKKLIKKNSNDNTINKFEYNDDFGFYIDLENGRLIDNNGELSYTFPMFRESEEKLENIVFKPIENGEMEAYIAKYNVDSEEFSELTLEEKEDLAPEFYRIYFGGIQYVCSDFVYTVTTYPNCPHPGGVHSNGLICEPTTTTYVTTFCSWMDPNNGGGSGGGGSTGGNTGDTGGNYTGSSGGSGTGGVSTTPVLISSSSNREKCFIKGLSDEQQQWLNNNPTSNNSITLFLESSIEDEFQDCYNSNDVEKIIDLINFSISNNCTFIIDPSITNQNANIVGNLSDLGIFFNNINITQASDLELINDVVGNTKTARFKFTLDTWLYLNCAVKQNLPSQNITYSVANVSSNISGFTIGATWNQNDNDFDNIVSNNISSTTFTGGLSFTFFNGIGIFITHNVLINLNTNSTTGAPISGSFTLTD